MYVCSRREHDFWNEKTDRTPVADKRALASARTDETSTIPAGLNLQVFGPRGQRVREFDQQLLAAVDVRTQTLAVLGTVVDGYVADHGPAQQQQRGRQRNDARGRHRDRLHYYYRRRHWAGRPQQRGVTRQTGAADGPSRGMSGFQRGPRFGHVHNIAADDRVCGFRSARRNNNDNNNVTTPSERRHWFRASAATLHGVPRAAAVFSCLLSAAAREIVSRRRKSVLGHRTRTRKQPENKQQTSTVITANYFRTVIMNVPPAHRSIPK